MKVLVTGAAGFIGYSLVVSLLDKNYTVIGVDNINDYYDQNLKRSRLQEIKRNPKSNNFQFYEADISNKNHLDQIFSYHDFDSIVHLAAQAGVRHSITNPFAYVESNLVGHVNMLECCRDKEIKHFIYASSSSVYGTNPIQPFSITSNTDTPISLYAASKKSNELISYSYSHLYNIPSTGIRFFTVYGPYGRPDMAYFKFTKNIFENKPIEVFNNGNMKRDFTYVDDAIEGMSLLLEKPPTSNLESNEEKRPPHRILNIGSSNPVKLNDFIEVIEKAIGKKAIKVQKEMQPGDVLSTFADISEIQKLTGFKPRTKIDQGINKFVEWYRKYFECIS